jgi:ubiquinone/menaquinone biosynthesis C-methylase UbiE
MAMPAQQHAKKILSYYNDPAVTAYYDRQQYITRCEQLLFSTYIKPGMQILDIGVGGGRTSEYLARNASRYVGIDYASEMVNVCRRKYPQWEYFESSATDLSRFQKGSFDVIVMSYNILDDLIPDENRWICLRECHRVLRAGGFLIFSSHNPRSIIVRRENEGTKSHPTALSLGLFGRASASICKGLHYAATVFAQVGASMLRALRYGLKRPFWTGEGYMLDRENLMTHYWTPAKAIAELTRYGFRFITLQGDDYPRASHPLVTDWYYYVFQR